MDNPITLTVSLELVSSIFNEIHSILINKYNEEKSIVNISKTIYTNIESYYLSTCERLAHFKTYLFNFNTVNFEDVYYPLNVEGFSFDYKVTINKELNKLFNYNKRITIIGSAGSGKTMLTKRIFLSSLESINKIPIIVELRKLEDGGTIENFIKNILSQKNINISDDILITILKSGKFLFIFDGYDELQYKDQNQKKDVFKKVTENLENFTRLFRDNSYIVTSRIGAKAEYLEAFDTYKICELSENDIRPFIKLQCKQIDDGKKLAKSIINKISDKNVNQSYFDFFKNPLLLTLFIKTYNSFPELPSSKWEFYENVFNTLWITHDSITKSGGYLRSKNYPKKYYEKILRTFSYITYFKQIFIFSDYQLYYYLTKAIKDSNLKCEVNLIMEDLVTSISIFFRDGNDYIFPHRSMQEYFLANYISTLSPNLKQSVYNRLRKDIYMHTNVLMLLSEIDEYSFCSYFLQNYLWDCFQLFNETIEDFLKILDYCFLDDNFINNLLDKYKDLINSFSIAYSVFSFINSKFNIENDMIYKIEELLKIEYKLKDKTLTQVMSEIPIDILKQDINKQINLLSSLTISINRMDIFMQDYLIKIDKDILI